MKRPNRYDSITGISGLVRALPVPTAGTGVMEGRDFAWSFACAFLLAHEIPADGIAPPVQRNCPPVQQCRQLCHDMLMT